MLIKKILIFEIFYYILLILCEKQFMILEEYFNIVFIKILCYIIYMNLFLLKNIRLLNFLYYYLKKDINLNYLNKRTEKDYNISIKVNLFFLFIYYGCYTALIIEDVLNELKKNIIYMILLFSMFYIKYKINLKIIQVFFKNNKLK